MARKDADMTQGDIWRHFLSFSVPLAIGLLFQQLYNTVDSVVVGQYVGQEALAAVGSTGSIINMIPMGGDFLIEINFENIGTKKLMLRAAAQHMSRE